MLFYLKSVSLATLLFCATAIAPLSIPFPPISPALAQTIQERKAEADRLLQQGIQQYRTGQREAALQSLQQALAVRRAIQDRHGEAYVLMNLGNAYQEDSPQYEQAITYYEQAHPIFQQVNDSAGEADLLFNLGRAYRYLSQPEKAISYYEQARLMYQQLQYHKSEADSLMIVGEIYESQLQYEIAIRSYEQARLIYQQNNNPNAVATALLSLGSVYDSLSQYEKAIDYYKRSLDIAQEVGNRWNEGAALINLGDTYSSLSRYAEAIEYLEQSLVIKREANDRLGESSALGNLGIAYMALGSYAKAAEYLEQTLTIHRELKDRLQEGRTLGNLGDIYRRSGNYEKAIVYQEQSLAIARQLNDRPGESYSLMGLGAIYQDSGDFAKAINYQEQSLTTIRKMNDRSGEAAIIANIGLMFSDYGFPAQAIDYLKQSLAISREIGERERESELLGNIANVLAEYLEGYPETMGKYKQPELAIAFYKQSINIRQTIRQDISKLPRETQEIYTGSIARTYRSLADLLLTQGRIREAQVILELLKVQETQSYGRNQQQNSTVQLSLHPLESQALQTFERTIISHLDLSNETLAKISHALIQNRDRVIQESNNTPTAIGNPQVVLQANPNALLIQNLVVGDKLWVIWTNASGKTTAIAVPNVSQTQLTTTVEQFRQQIGSPYSDLVQLKANSNKLYNWLIPPQLQAELDQNPQQHLIFSLDHVTRYIPVAVLFDGNQYLVQRYRLSNLITTASDTSDRLALEGQTPTVLALGISKALSGFNPLPNVPTELNAIVRDGNNKGIYPGKIRLDAAFTANSLRDNRDSFRILHIATHGSFNPKSITASFLLLGDGSRLPITDIAALTNINTTHLVVLSACETGLSNSTQDGTEISGISGYFFYRGAKAVIASLWSVNDASTSLLMQRFYQHLANGMSKATALQQVQQDFIQGNLTAKDTSVRSDISPTVDPGVRALQTSTARFSHPYYWAPFILIGNSL